MHRVIYDELCVSVVREPSREVVIGRLVTEGVLGCTEIELLITADGSPVPVFPTTRLPVEAAVTGLWTGTFRASGATD